MFAVRAPMHEQALFIIGGVLSETFSGRSGLASKVGLIATCEQATRLYCIRLLLVAAA